MSNYCASACNGTVIALTGFYTLPRKILFLSLKGNADPGWLAVQTLKMTLLQRLNFVAR